MLKLLTFLAATLAATATFAGPNAGENLIRSNVPAASGSVPGFFLSGIGYFVEYGYEDRATVAAITLPEGVNSKDLSEVLTYLSAAGYDVTPRLRSDETERSTESFAVSVEVSPGVFEDFDRIRFITSTSRAVNGGW